MKSKQLNFAQQIGNVQIPDQTICDRKDCEWKGTTHAKSWHWVTQPKDYYPNGDKKPL